MQALRAVHIVFGWTAIGANALAGVVALVAFGVPRARGRWVWVVTIVAEAMMMLEVVMGVVLLSGDRYEVERFHMFYGFVAFLTVGLAFQYRDALRGRAELLYGLVGLFMMGLGLRAVVEVGA